ncbi:phosphoribosylamine--glycine ligase [Kushneria marisflavi]|uniref:Phosphoribosylamine--glycine ligase n=1 Tax=Kushneria marisflavi TaxID=157779 RepID=A0A240UU26_9GAMM|nr:phosphoribosylamine--glycine ligase [Kushneria marisflavi]ART64552.1 phosphoribosylamine--glycine ligase [Kushneria marisflavi]RKD87243.1 phosphoribosylamine--glycine ligase [Kushneria marisflavi]
MKVLMIGGGGREHALAWKLAQSPRVDEVLLAPGNAGTAREPGLRNVDVASGDIEGLLAVARSEAVALTVVGPEAPLVAGVVDRFQAEGLRIFGPSAAAAQLEGSKAFSKDFLARHGIPTAHYQSFTEVAPALAYLESQGAPIVIKADGLAAGKGVIVAMDMAQARAAIHDMLEDNAFGDAGARVVIEEYLEGEEASFIVMADGYHVVEMATSQDHKRVGDNDSGANTGGMGAYSPAPVVTESVRQRVMREIIMPTIQGMKADGHAYTGFLYAGLMIDDQGAPRVIEYNCRFGDPETQPIMLRLQSDLVTLCEAAIDGQLDQYHCQWDPRSAVGVVMAAEGYPGSYRKGDVITGFDEAQRLGCHVFHAGTRESENGTIETAGGRVLCVTALGDDVKAARDLAYEGVAAMQFEGGFYRSDIAARAINR